MGSIEAGAVADCVLYDLDAFSLLPHADPIVSLVLSSARPTVGTYFLDLEQNEPSLHFVHQNDYQDYFNAITAGKTDHLRGTGGSQVHTVFVGGERLVRTAC